MPHTNLSSLTMKLFFLKFCSLWTKLYVLAGLKNIHSVCVCTIHQNVKLMLSSIGLAKSYYQIIKMIVGENLKSLCG